MKSLEQILRETFLGSAQGKLNAIAEPMLLNGILDAGKVMQQCHQAGGAIMVAPLSELLYWKANHLVEELVGKYRAQRPSVCSYLFANPEMMVDCALQWPFGERDIALILSQPHGRSSFSLSLVTSNEKPRRLLEVRGKHPAEISSTISLIIHLLCEFFEPRKEGDAVDDNALKRAWASSYELDLDLHKNERFLSQVLKCESHLDHARRNRSRIVINGNGGSACDGGDAHLLALSQHLPGSPFYSLLPPLDAGTVTCIANDWGYDTVFQRALSNAPADKTLFIGISTSGNSPSILKALATAKELSIPSLALGGRQGGMMLELNDLISVLVPHDATERIQEAHASILGAYVRFLRCEEE